MPIFPFAHRTDWSLQNNLLSLAIEALKAQGIEILDLTESNPTRCGFDYPQSWLNHLSNPSNLLYAPESQGVLQAREAIGGYYAQRQLKIDTKQLLLTSSTSEGYSFLLKLLTNPGDHVLIPAPSYPLFQFLLELHDVQFDFYPLVYEGSWGIDQERFKALVTPRTRAVIVVNPNNPTCSYLSPEDREFLNEQCLQNQAAIISDEVFLDYQLAQGMETRSLIENTKVLTFVLSGISKILGLPQMKLSWIGVNGPTDTVHKAIEKLEIISDTYLSVNTPVQKAIAQWLPEADYIQSQILRRVKGNFEALLAQGFKVLAVQGGWYAIIEVPNLEVEEEFILGLLKEDHVLIHPGYFFDFEKEGYLVLSLLPQPEIFDKAIEQILRKIKIL